MKSPKDLALKMISEAIEKGLFHGSMLPPPFSLQLHPLR
jgi:hypothetical protein